MTGVTLAQLVEEEVKRQTKGMNDTIDRLAAENNMLKNQMAMYEQAIALMCKSMGIPLENLVNTVQQNSVSAMFDDETPVQEEPSKSPFM